MAAHRFKRRRGRRPSFLTVLLATVLAAFALAYWWPEITTRTPTEMWAAVVEPDRAAYIETDQVASLAPKKAAMSDRRELRFSCQVSSVTDGDTLRCADGVRVRPKADVAPASRTWAARHSRQGAEVRIERALFNRI